MNWRNGDPRARSSAIWRGRDSPASAWTTTASTAVGLNGELPPIDHPDESSRCIISGTGLTHLGSARDRQSMHAADTNDMTDSMKMFQWGKEGGRRQSDASDTPPEWFYKGTGAMLRGHGQPLEIPAYAEDGGEEAEIAGVYVIARDGSPYRVGMAGGNEFSDHQFEKKNYLIWPAQSFEPARWVPNSCWIPNSNLFPSRPRSCAKVQCYGPKPFAAANPKCATACKTLSIIISNFRRTASRVTSTCISLAPIA